MVQWQRSKILLQERWTERELPVVAAWKIERLVALAIVYSSLADLAFAEQIEALAVQLTAAHRSEAAGSSRAETAVAARKNSASDFGFVDDSSQAEIAVVARWDFASDFGFETDPSHTVEPRAAESPMNSYWNKFVLPSSHLKLR